MSATSLPTAPSPSAAIPATVTLCPRCGYDQSGLWATKDESTRAAAALGPADLGRGTCAECGLEFEWRSALFPFEREARGFVEHVEKRVFLAAWRTMAWCLWPGVFWRRVKVEYRIVPRRWWVWLAAVLLVPWVLISLAMTAQDVTQMSTGRAWWSDAKVWEWLLNRWTWPIATWGGPNTSQASPWSWSAWWPTVRDWWFIVPPLTANATLALMMGVLDGSWRAARVRDAHLARIAVFGIGWIGALALASVPLHMLAWALDALTAPGVYPRGLRLVHLAFGAQAWLAWACVAWVIWWWDRALVVGLQIGLAWHERGLVALAGALGAMIVIVTDIDTELLHWAL
ncbi:MAG: hypothetical protein SFY95_00485 [Planctomycetota bacterium]|nr:hypothetical protein [Planctomycetota bacterium]